LRIIAIFGICNKTIQSDDTLEFNVTTGVTFERKPRAVSEKSKSRKIRTPGTSWTPRTSRITHFETNAQIILKLTPESKVRTFNISRSDKICNVTPVAGTTGPKDKKSIPYAYYQNMDGVLKFPPGTKTRKLTSKSPRISPSASPLCQVNMHETFSNISGCLATHGIGKCCDKLLEDKMKKYKQTYNVINVVDMVHHTKIDIKGMFIIQTIQNIINNEGCNCHSLNEECQSIIRIFEMLGVDEVYPPPPTPY